MYYFGSKYHQLKFTHLQEQNRTRQLICIITGYIVPNVSKHITFLTPRTKIQNEIFLITGITKDMIKYDEVTVEAQCVMTNVLMKKRKENVFTETQMQTRLREQEKDVIYELRSSKQFLPLQFLEKTKPVTLCLRISSLHSDTLLVFSLEVC